MPTQKTEAVVLKSIKLGETSKIVTTYTLRFGIEQVVAKGSRGTKSRYWGCLEPLNYVNMQFYLKPNRDLQFLSDVDIIQPFSCIRKDLTKTAYALAICEMLLKTQLPGEPNAALFNLSVQALNAIDTTPNSPFTIFLGFQLKFLDLAGFNPEISSCLTCHRKVTNELVVFDPANGGFICTGCATHRTGVVLSARGLRFLNWLRKSALTEMTQYNLPPDILTEAEKVLAAYIHFHLEDLGHLKALDFLAHL
jgi:DNA repair protein RecO (recombination protein O)